MRPKSSSETLISRSAMERIVPSSTGTSYVLPVRLSVIVRESDAVATPPSPFVPCSSVAMVSGSSWVWFVCRWYPLSRTGVRVRGARGLGGEDGAGHRAQHEDGGERHHATCGPLGGREVVADDPERADPDGERGEQAAAD